MQLSALAEQIPAYAEQIPIYKYGLCQGRGFLRLCKCKPLNRAFSQSCKLSPLYFLEFMSEVEKWGQRKYKESGVFQSIRCSYLARHHAPVFTYVYVNTSSTAPYYPHPPHNFSMRCNHSYSNLNCKNDTEWWPSICSALSCWAYWKIVNNAIMNKRMPSSKKWFRGQGPMV